MSESDSGELQPHFNNSFSLFWIAFVQNARLSFQSVLSTGTTSAHHSLPSPWPSPQTAQSICLYFITVNVFSTKLSQWWCTLSIHGLHLGSHPTFGFPTNELQRASCQYRHFHCKHFVNLSCVPLDSPFLLLGAVATDLGLTHPSGLAILLLFLLVVDHRWKQLLHYLSDLQPA